MSEEKKKSHESEPIHQRPFLRMLVIASLCTPPCVLSFVCLQLIFGLFRNVLAYPNECMLAMTIFVGGFVCGLIGLFGARANGWLATIVQALLGMTTNALGFVLSVLVFSAGSPHGI